MSLRTPVAPIFGTAPWTPRFWHDLPNRQPHLFLLSHRHLIQQHHAGARTETHKTGVRRNLPLSPETIQALKEPPRSGQLVFYTLEGHPWVTTVVRTKSNGEREYTPVNRITPTFSRLMKKVGVYAPKGTGFYALRRTAATMAARSGDPFAVQRLLGHVDLTMATRYVQDVSEQTDRVIENSRKYAIREEDVA